VEQQYQQLAREQMVCGCHVHVGIDDRDEAVEVLNWARPWLPTILAVSGNSPFWLGDNTGYCSYRNGIWNRWPLAGIPDSFIGRSQYDAMVEFLLTTGALDDFPRLYFDIRLSKKFDIVEVRIADVCMSVDEAVLVAALVRALLQTCPGQVVRAEPAPQVRRDLLQVAVWRAARYGDCDDLLDLPGNDEGRPRKVVDRLIEFVRPVL
jgi:carboxylate-amine ligase